jgi:hypothetical protein
MYSNIFTFMFFRSYRMITTPTTLPAPVQQTFDDVLLSVRTPNLIHKLGAEYKRLPAKGGRTLKKILGVLKFSLIYLESLA